MSVDPRVKASRSWFRPPTGGGLLSSSGLTSVAAAIGALPGLLIPVLIARLIGANDQTDAFFLALAAASLIAATLGTTIPQAAIPFFVEQVRLRRSVGRMTHQVIVGLLALAIAISAATGPGILAAVQRTAGDLDPTLVVRLLAVLMIYAWVAVASGVYGAALNAEQTYARVAVSPALRSLPVVAAILFYDRVLPGMAGVAFGYLLGEILRLAYLAWLLDAMHPLRVRPLPLEPSSVSFLRAALPQVVGAGLLALMPLVDRVMASGLAEGQVSLLEFAERACQMPVTFAMAGFMTVSLARWSARFQAAQTDAALTADIARLARATFLVALPACALVAIFRFELVGWLFGQTIGEADRRVLGDTLGVLIAGIPFYVAGLIYTRGFIVRRRTDLMTGIIVIQVMLKLALNVWFVARWGIVGLALATTLMYIAMTLMLAAASHFGRARA